MRDRAAALFRRLQDEIVAALETFEPQARFRRDLWTRDAGGGGDTRVIEGGELLEKGGVAFSEVWGELPVDFAKTLPGQGTSFWAAGVSLVLHPRNPYVPTVHANFRAIAQCPPGAGGPESQTLWFGGGADLTPYYPFEEDARHFHRTLKAACDAHEPSWHPRFKAWCDQYFFIPHRHEARGVGGIFYDHLLPEKEGKSLDELLAFQTTAGESFLGAYLPIVERRHHLAYGERERAFQAYRRGRYVEFNLMYDRGTLFGLKTNGRVESILMSLPPTTGWRYDFHPEPGSPEAKIYELIVPRDWTADE